MNYFKKFCNLLKSNKNSNIDEYDNNKDDVDLDDYPVYKSEKFNISNNPDNDDLDKYPISKSKAFDIANDPYNLKTDFYKRDKRSITFMSFTDYDIDLVDYNGEKHWLIKINDGEVSWVEHNIIGETFCDGIFIKKDFSKLKCLINANTGEYTYCTKEILKKLV